MLKIIKEMLPNHVRIAKDAQELLVECCVGIFSPELYDKIVSRTYIFTRLML